MSKKLFAALAMALVPFGAFAVDGVVLINQSTVMAAGGFPYIITQSGSYRLSGNLIVPAGMDGIQIKTSDVTVDLNGFEIAGPFAGQSAGIGINATDQTNAVILSGRVIHMGVTGIVTGGFARLEKLQANNNGVGIIVGPNSSIIGCVAHNNSSTGILALQNAFIQNNNASFNGGSGIYAPGPTSGATDGTVSNVVGNTANNNLIDGISVTEALVSGNTAIENMGRGFIVFGGVVAGNLAMRNKGDGLYIVSALITGNTSKANGGVGLFIASFLGEGATYKGNVLAKNTGGNLADGGTFNLGENLCGQALCP